MTRDLERFGFRDIRYNKSTDVYSGLYDGLVYVWPGRIIRKLAGAPYASEVYDLFDDKYCADEFVLAAERGVM